MADYCDYCNSHPEDTYNKDYHDLEYGFPLKDDNRLFERLMLEINQAGLSWITILKKKDHFHSAYDGFDVDTVADYNEKDRARLLADAGIIRNRLKVNAAIENARRIQVLQADYGSFKKWLDSNHPQDLDAWAKSFKKTFLFTGGEIVREFLISTGYLPGAHDSNCPIFMEVKRKNPPWMKILKSGAR
jgi:DNA-3-methyladenine glycosylase I